MIVKTTKKKKNLSGTRKFLSPVQPQKKGRTLTTSPPPIISAKTETGIRKSDRNLKDEVLTGVASVRQSHCYTKVGLTLHPISSELLTDLPTNYILLFRWVGVLW